MLNKIKILLGISDASKDVLLNVLLDSALTEAYNYTSNDDIPDNIICEMVCYKYRTLGSEGLESENYSGVSFDYSEDYPETILRQLKAFRRVRTI